MQRTHLPRAGVAIGLGLALVAVSLLTAAPGLAYHAGLDTVHERAASPAGAYGVSVELEQPGDLEFVVNGYGEQSSAPASHGAVSYDVGGDPQGMVVIGVHDPPDRFRASTSLGAEPGTTTEDGIATTVRPAPGAAETGDVTVTAESQPADGDEAEVTQRMFVRMLNRETGTHQAIVWLGDFEQTDLQVQTDGEVGEVHVTTGASHVAGDSDLEEGLVDVQAQDSFVGGSIPLDGTDAVGAKAIVDASVEVDAEQGLYGIWSLYDSRGACVPGPTCASTTQAFDGCRATTGLACGLGSLSWENEHDAAAGAPAYAYWDTEPGAHTFTLDHKLDAFEADLSGPGRVSWSEQLSLLSVADVDPPDA